MITGVGERITLLRKSKKLTQADLANMLNISHQSISKWERSESYPDVSMLVELRSILETTIDYLLIGISSNNQSFETPITNELVNSESELRNYIISSLDKGNKSIDLDNILKRLPSIDLRDVLIYALDKGKTDFDLSKSIELIPSIDLRDVLLVAIDHGKYDFKLKKVVSRLQPSEFEDLATAIKNDGIDTELDIELNDLINSRKLLKVNR